jgi:hypothetical protein
MPASQGFLTLFHVKHLSICTALWRRRRLAPIWWRAIRRVCTRFAAHNIRADVWVGGSEPWHERLARANGARWVPAENRPLGRKWNTVVQEACLKRPDFLMILGSDDFLGDGVIDRYAALLHDGWLHLGLCGCYMWEPATGRLGLFQPSVAPFGQPIGAGRVVARTFLTRSYYRPWLDELNSRMDADMALRCQLPVGHRLPVSPEVMAVDVKTRDNIWSLDRIGRMAGDGLSLVPLPPHPALAEWEDLRRLRVSRETPAIA